MRKMKDIRGTHAAHVRSNGARVSDGFDADRDVHRSA